MSMKKINNFISSVTFSFQVHFEVNRTNKTKGMALNTIPQEKLECKRRARYKINDFLVVECKIIINKVRA